MDNGRRFERQTLRAETLMVSGAGARSFSGCSRDISLSGIFVETKDPIELGEELQMFVGSLRSAAALRVHVRVVHVVPGIGFGAHFADESDEARDCVAAFVRRSQR